MKAPLIIVVFLVLSCAAQGQNTTRLTREERKELKAEQYAQKAIEVSALIQDTLFLIEANRFSASGAVYGSTPKYNSELGTQRGSGTVNPSLYFIQVAKDQIIVQTGLMNESDVNGVAGVTLRGKIREFEITPSKNGKSTRIKLNFSSSFGFYRMDCRITNQGLSSVNLESLGTSAQMNFRGQIIDPSKSKVYMGGPVY